MLGQPDLREKVKMSVKFHCTVSQYTTGNVVRAWSFVCVDPTEGSPNAVLGQRHHLVARRRWSLLCSGAVFASKRARKAFTSFSREILPSQVCGGDL